jgi:transposase
MRQMSMGTRETDQPPLWIAASDLPASPGHPFYAQLNAVLEAHGFDRFAEDQCRAFYAKVMGRPSLPPGQYFRLLLVGYFEGIDSERGIAWRATDSLAVRSFVRLALHEAAPDHTTLSRTRRLIDVETHRAVFTWVQQRLVEVGLLTGRTVAIDATTLEANAAMRSIVRRDTAETDAEFLTRLAQASGIETPTREDLARLDRTRKKKTSNKEWTNPFDPDAKVTKMKDGRTHLAHKAEHAVDLETGAIIAVTLQGADHGDTTTIVETATAAAEQIEDAQADVDEPQPLEEIIADKGYHSNQTMVDLDAVGIRSILKRLLIHAGAFNLGLVMRQLIGLGTPRGLQGSPATVLATLLVLLRTTGRRLVATAEWQPPIAAIGCLTLPIAKVVNSSAATTYATGS